MSVMQHESMSPQALLDKVTEWVRTDNVCRWCKTPWPEHKVYMDVVDGRFAPIECLDLDEGPAA